MTYGMSDGTLPPDTEEEDYTPQEYRGGDYTDSSQGTLEPGGLSTVPVIPANATDGSGKNTSVDTSSLKRFALKQPVSSRKRVAYKSLTTGKDRRRGTWRFVHGTWTP
ncbi:hypothetical protein ACWCQW_51570 [Streptomyces mirabilis]